jgi:hypothetical protein
MTEEKIFVIDKDHGEPIYTLESFEDKEERAEEIKEE